MPIFVPEVTQELQPLRTGQVVPREDGGLGAVAQGLSRASGALHEAALRQQRTRNAERLFTAETQLQDLYRTFEADARGRTGANAHGVTGDAQKWWSENTRKISEGLENDAQRALFDQSAGRMRETSLDSFSAYEAEQNRAALDDSGRSAIASAIDFAASQTGNPAAIAEARGDVLSRVDVLSNLNGWGPERREVETSKALTALHTQILENLADTNPVAAREYLAKHRDEIAGSALDQVHTMLETADNSAAAQRASDEIISKGGTLTESLAAARRGYEGKVRDDVERRVKQHFADIASAVELEQRQADDEGAKIFAEVNRVSAIPPSVQNRMSGQMLISLRKQELTPAERTETNWERFNYLRDLAVDSPAAFSALDLRAEYGALNQSERTALETLQTKIRNNQYDDVATLEQQLSTVRNQYGWDTDDEEFGLLQRRAREAIDAEQRVKGKPLTMAERQQVIDTMLIQSTWMFGRDFYFEVAGTPAAEKFEPANEDDRATLQNIRDRALLDQAFGR